MAENKSFFFFYTLYDCVRTHFQVENMKIDHVLIELHENK